MHWEHSPITIFVEHNLGFEAEHHERALRGLKNVTFYRDEKRQRVGMLTTLPVKHSMCTLCNAYLREKRLSASTGENFISEDEQGLKKLLREEMEMYSYQFKVCPLPSATLLLLVSPLSPTICTTNVSLG